MAKTTPKHFSIFKAECNKWIDILGLKGWDWHFKHEYLKDNRAEYYYRATGRTCVVTLSTEFEDKVADDEIRLCAFHEIYEMSFSDLRSMCLSFFAYDYVDEAIHRLVRIGENVLYPKY